MEKEGEDVYTHFHSGPVELIKMMHTGIHDISYLYLALLSYLPFCSSKFVNKEVQNSNEMLIKSVRELKRFPHLGGGFTSQYAQ